MLVTATREPGGHVTIQKIVCAHDLIPASEGTLELAFNMARPLGANVIVVHVAVPPMQGEEVFGDYTAREVEIHSGAAHREEAKIEQTLAAHVAALNPPGEGAVPCQIIVREGVPVDVLNEVAVEQGASLLIVGTHARRGLSHMLLGSVAEKLVRSAPCPVLVARPRSAA